MEQAAASSKGRSQVTSGYGARGEHLLHRHKLRREVAVGLKDVLKDALGGVDGNAVHKIQSTAKRWRRRWGGR